jgi:mRNA interferase RelE/StbE
MQVFFEPAFIKDLQALEPDIRRRVEGFCLEIVPAAKDIRDCFECDLKRMVGRKNHYRVRIGDYRIGFKIDNGIIVFVRVLHRKEMYRHFP